MIHRTAALCVGFTYFACSGAEKAGPAPSASEIPNEHLHQHQEPDSSSTPVITPSSNHDSKPTTSATENDHDVVNALALEQTAYEQAKPVLEAYCAKCHAKGDKKGKPNALKHFDMTSYPFGGHHSSEIAAEIRKSLGIGGGKPTMPLDRPGSVQGDELVLIAAWADAFDRAHPAGAKDGHDPSSHKDHNETGQTHKHKH